MGLNQGQGQLGQFANQLFEAAVFLSPLFGLGYQFHGHVSGMYGSRLENWDRLVSLLNSIVQTITLPSDRGPLVATVWYE